MTGRSVLSQNGSQRNGVHGEVLHIIGDENHQSVKSYYDQGLS